jgi:hypothetical protein
MSVEVNSNSNATSIHDLPVDPLVGGNSNIALNVSEKTMGQSMGQSISLDPSTISQIVSGLQQASSSGATSLPSRDIPQITQNLTHDPQIIPTFIPSTSNSDYILQQEQNSQIIDDYNRQHQHASSLDQMYDELQIPILIGVIYFLFQLPVFKTYLFKFAPALFMKDGNINIYGYIFTSILFALTYFLLSKTVHFSHF